jgi:monoamine oxidase
MDVIVVGAGLAGLAAADELRREGAVVTLLEAQDRVGGRVWSAPFGDAAVVERGAEFVLPGNTTMMDAAERFGLRLVRKGTRYGDRTPRGGALVSPADLDAAVRRVRAAAPHPHGTVAQRLEHLGLTGPAGEALRARIEISNCHPADDLDARVLEEGAAGFGDFDTYSVEGGNGRLAGAIAASLGDAIHLHAPVWRVAWANGRVSVSAGETPVEAASAGGTPVEAAAAVLAVPPRAMDAIAFDPPLPEEKANALRSVCLGQAAKMFVGLRAPAPPSATMSVPDRFWCYTQLAADGRPHPVVAALAGTSGALDRLAVADGPAIWVEKLSRLRPDLELDLETATVVTWKDDPWVRGAYSARSLSSPMDDEQLARPVGPLAFAGEHTAAAWHGLMEGALRSGRRAARELLDR